VVYGHSNKWRTFYSFNDIYVRERKTGEVRQLTSGLRARHPAVSPDGQQVAFVTNELGTMSLAVVPFDGGKPTVVYKGVEGDQIFYPRWSPNGKQLVYSRWRAGGNRDIYLMEVKTRKVRRITSDRAMDIDPVFGPGGDRIYFASDRTGIYNIYCHDLQTGRLWQVTNLVSGAFVPAVSPDERSLYYVGYSSKGYDLHAMELKREDLLPALPYVNDRPAPTKIPEEKTYPDRPYSPLSTLYPRAWTFDIGSATQGTTLGLELSGGDVVGRHRYTVVGRVNTAMGQPSYALSYVYSRFWPSFVFSNSRFEGPRGGVVIDGEKRTYNEENYAFGTSIGLPVLRVPNHSGNVSVGYQLNWFRDGDDTSVVVEPGMLSPRLPEVGILAGVTLGLSYNSTQRYDYSISTESGRRVSISLRVDHPSLGSDYKSTRVVYGWTEYIDLPWANEHVLALRLSGGIAGGDLKRRGIFFLGGFPEQDILRSLMDNTHVGGAYLRGYAPGVVYGNQYHLLNVEYRLPLLDIEKGLLSLPIYATHIHLATFVDFGNAFYGEPVLEEFKVGVGAEAFFELVIGYIASATFRVGYARGLMDPGGNEFHFLLGRTF
jgi:hypothetical protein